MRFFLLLSVPFLCSSSTIDVYHPSQFHLNKLCQKSPCRSFEVCVVADEKRECINKDQLILEIGHAKFVEHGKHEEKVTHHHKHNTEAAHISHEDLGNKGCTRGELARVGGRLLKWFSDIHALYGVEDTANPSHAARQHVDIKWMFSQFDGNQDGFLSRAELVPLEDGPHEKCIKQFVDHCDNFVVDGLVSLEEWTECMKFEEDQRHEPPCHKHKHSLDPHLIGVFLPRCDQEGFYLTEQCHEGFCWCVDKYGREMDGSRVRGDLPDCGQYASSLQQHDLEDLRARI